MKEQRNAAVMKKKRKYKVVFNSPVTLSFTFICVAALILNAITGGLTNALLFSVYRAPLTDFFGIFRLVGHVIGHSSLGHLVGNFMMILILGPILEEKYGSVDLLIIILVTAVVTGIIHIIFFPRIALLGASGVAFAFILLSSFTSFREGEIPMTFILVAVLYLGEQIIQGFFGQDNISQLTHILGGIVGAVIGFIGGGNTKKI